MTIQRFDVGDSVHIACTTTNENDAPTDPDELVLLVQVNEAEASIYRWPTPGPGESGIDRNGTGDFSIDTTMAASGVVRWRWIATGAVTSSEAGYFFVRPAIPSMPTP